MPIYSSIIIKDVLINCIGLLEQDLSRQYGRRDIDYTLVSKILRYALV